MKPGDLIRLEPAWGQINLWRKPTSWTDAKISDMIGDPLAKEDVGLVLAVVSKGSGINDDVLVIFGTRVGWRERNAFVPA